MSAALLALIVGRNALLGARVDAAIAMGQADTWVLESVLEEKRHIVALLTELAGERNKASTSEVAFLLEGLVDRVRLHLDTQPVDFARIKELLEAGVEACEAAS